MPGLLENSLDADAQAFEALGANTELAKDKYIEDLRAGLQWQTMSPLLGRTLGGALSAGVGLAGWDEGAQKRAAQIMQDDKGAQPVREPAPHRSHVLGAVLRRMAGGLLHNDAASGAAPSDAARPGQETHP